MKKLFFIIANIIFTLSMTSITLNADSYADGRIESYYAVANRCDKMMKKYDIDPSIRSIRGWKRTINNDQLSLYIKDISIYDKKIVGQCLISKGFNIDKLTRGIGVKK